jgi:hypothetical protein
MRKSVTITFDIEHTTNMTAKEVDYVEGIIRALELYEYFSPDVEKSWHFKNIQVEPDILNTPTTDIKAGVMEDQLGTVCYKCCGTFQERTMYDDLDGTLRCPCGVIIKRYKVK